MLDSDQPERTEAGTGDTPDSRGGRRRLLPS